MPPAVPQKTDAEAARLDIAGAVATLAARPAPGAGKRQLTGRECVACVTGRQPETWNRRNARRC